MELAISFNLSARRAPSTTLAPLLASRRALASPIPEEAPVMMMTLSLIMMNSLLVQDSGAVLLLGDLLEPVDGLAVEHLIDGDVSHRGLDGGAMPVLFAGREPDDVAGPNFLDWSAPALHATDARGDDQRLPEGMGVPGGSGTRLERDLSSLGTSGFGRAEKRVDPDGSGEPVGRTLAGWLCA